MRYTFTLLFILNLLTSCTKKYCWKCTITEIVRNGGSGQVIKNDVQECDKTNKEMLDIQKAGTYEKNQR